MLRKSPQILPAILLMAAGLANIAGLYWHGRAFKFTDDTPAMVFGTSLDFVIASLAFLLPPILKDRERLARMAPAVLLMVMRLSLLPVRMRQVDLGLDLPEIHRWLEDTRNLSGRLSPFTEIAFLLAGVALLLDPAERDTGRWLRWLTVTVFFTGLLTIAGYLIGIDDLLSAYLFHLMAPTTALCFMMLGAALWLSWRGAEWNRNVEAADRRILRAATLTLAAMISVSALSGYALFKRSATDILGESLQQILSSRLSLLDSKLRLLNSRADMGSTYGEIVPSLRALQKDRNDAAANRALLYSLSSVTAYGFSAIRAELADGTVVSTLGHFADSDHLQVANADDTSLLWGNGLILHRRSRLSFGGQTIGWISSELPLTDGPPLGSGNSSDLPGMSFEFCRREETVFLCFPDGIQTAMYRVPIGSGNQGAFDALGRGEQGISHRIDYRGRAVLELYAPLGRTGFIGVVKVEASDIYFPILLNFLWGLLFLAAMIAGAIVLLRRYLSPLTQDLVEARAEAVARTEALAKSVQRWRISMENAPIGKAIVAIDGRWTEVNRALCEFLGYDREELLRLSFQNVTYAEDLAADLGLAKQLLDGQIRTYSLDKRYVRKDGRVVWGRLQVSLVRDEEGKPDYFIAQIQDITEQRRQETALRDSLALQQAILDSADQAIIATDRAGTITSFNLAAERMTGYAEEDMVGTESPLVLHDPKELEEQAALLEREFGRKFTPELGVVVVRALEYGVDEREWTFVRKAGSRFPALLTITAIHDESGTIGFLGIAVDVTDRKQREAVIAAALKEKEILLKEVYHRVKNNLQIINSLLSLQQRTLPDGQARSILRESAERVRAMALVHEKLYQSGNLSSIDISLYVADLCNGLRAAYLTGGRAIRLIHHVDRIEMNIDRAIPLGLILNELVTNSLKHAFAEGQEGDIQIDIHRMDKAIELVVADNGKGLPAGYNAMESESLGLKLVMTLVRQLDGAVGVDGSNGTRWSVELPLAIEADA